jgi:hypothetical protein
MFKKDYEIKVMFDQNGEPHWKLYRKGEPVCANEEESKMVFNAFLELAMLV